MGVLFSPQPGSMGYFCLSSLDPQGYYSNPQPGSMGGTFLSSAWIHRGYCSLQLPLPGSMGLLFNPNIFDWVPGIPAPASISLISFSSRSLQGDDYLYIQAPSGREIIKQIGITSKCHFPCYFH